MAGYYYLIEFLKEEGYKYEENGNMLTFQIQGVSYLVVKNENTPFLQILIVCNTAGQSRSKQLEICNDMNASIAALKFIVNNSDRVLCAYGFIPGASTTADDYMTAFTTLYNGAIKFLERISE